MDLEPAGSGLENGNGFTYNSVDVRHQIHKPHSDSSYMSNLSSTGLLGFLLDPVTCTWVEIT